MFRTYILAERGDEICIIDKHAAHERQLFENWPPLRRCPEYSFSWSRWWWSSPPRKRPALLTNLDLLERPVSRSSDFGGSCGLPALGPR